MPSGLLIGAQAKPSDNIAVELKSEMSSFRKSPRMPGFDYRGGLTAHVTLVTRLRQPLFNDESLAQICLQALDESSQRFETVFYAYCLMPDHLHLLVGVDYDATLKQFVHHFKTMSSFRLKQLTGSSPWQTSYHDRVLRREEDIATAQAYVWHNPVQEGLAETWDEYPYSGPREAFLPP
jgi:REP element-mobilizing transposase RayT